MLCCDQRMLCLRVQPERERPAVCSQQLSRGKFNSRDCFSKLPNSTNLLASWLARMDPTKRPEYPRLYTHPVHILSCRITPHTQSAAFCTMRIKAGTMTALSLRCVSAFVRSINKFGRRPLALCLSTVTSSVHLTERLDGLDSPTVWPEFSPLSVKHGAINLGQGFPDWDPPLFVQEAMK